jgi:hypothetical protein
MRGKTRRELLESVTIGVTMLGLAGRSAGQDAKRPEQPAEKEKKKGDVASKKGKAAQAQPRATGGGFETGDPRAVLLRFGGRILPGEPGFRQGWASFRLRFGPGDWRGTKIRVATAWGDGNAGKDIWGHGSPGTDARLSDVYRDPQGFFFVLSLEGDDFGSNWVAAVFRFETPNEIPGVASALFPYK